MTKIRCAGDSDPGLVRKNNEDRVHFDAERGVFVVIDGIGGQAAGEKAADIALSMLRTRLERKTGTAEERLREGIAVANNEILRLAATREEWRGMACVLTAAVIEEGTATIGHVGDSRLYKIRNNEIHKLTHDHSPVGEREDANQISEVEAMRHPRRNEVYRDVGSEPHAPEDPDFVEIARARFESDSALLLCSDGLSDQVASAQIREIVERNAGNPYSAVRDLIAAANSAGGKDNVTALVVEGERFGKPPAAGYKKRSRVAGIIFSRWAMFVYGAILAALVLLFLRPAPKPVIVAPRTLTVGPAHVPTISAAMADARAGDTIEVLAGEYREEVKLKDGVVLRSRVPREATLTGGTGPEPRVAIAAEGIRSGRVSGFRVLSDPKNPLSLGVLVADSDIDIDDLEVAGAKAGIEIRGASKAALRGNVVRDSVYQGMIVGGTSTPRLLNNVFTGNGRLRGQLRPAISILGDARPMLLNNVFQRNGAGALGLPQGIDPDPTLKNNFFIDEKPFTRVPPRVVAGRPGH